MEQYLGPSGSIEIVMLQIAERVAALHSHHWRDKELLESSQGLLLHSDWRLGREKSSFDRATLDMARMACVGSYLTTCQKKKFPNAWEAC